MASTQRVEEGSSSQYMEDYEVDLYKINPLSSHGSSDSYSSTSSDNEDLFEFPGNNNDTDDNNHVEKPRPKSRKDTRVSFASSVGNPSRIPSSVFSVRPGTITDWSMTSNESLFSIQLGNNSSFSKDPYFIMYKSGDLTKLDEQILAQKDVLPSLKELDDMAAKNESDKAQATGNDQAKAVKTDDDSDPKSAPAEEVRDWVGKDPSVDHVAVVANISLEKKFAPEVAVVQNHVPIDINKVSSLSEDISTSFTFPVLAAADGGRLSSAYCDRNNKASSAAPLANQQQAPQPQLPPDQEEKQRGQENEITEEKEPQDPDTTQNDSSRSWFSWFPCCRRS